VSNLEKKSYGLLSCGHNVLAIIVFILYVYAWIRHWGQVLWRQKVVYSQC